ncbi:MAG: selenium cofactor biosynthesis protein YqeC [Anaerolineales bacterium]
MQLTRALRLKPRQLLTFTGAGGKTSALQRLLKEIPQDSPFLLTTTTHLGQRQLRQAVTHWIDSGQGDLVDLLTVLKVERRVLWTGPLDPTAEKWTGVPSARIDEIKAEVAAIDGMIAVEGDGARQRLVKAPAAHEPVIPAASDLVVPMANLAALGRPLSEEVAHRPGRLAEVVGAEQGVALSPAHLARLMTSDKGGLKGVPEGIEVRLLLNGLDDRNMAEAEALAEECLSRAIVVRSVALADLGAEGPVASAYGRIAGVVLAAGGASRMGDLKQVREWRGVPMVRRAVEVAQQAGLAPLVVIVGQGGDQVRAALTSTGVEVVENPDWESGQSSSMKIGLARAAAASEGVVFLLADMPLVEAEDIKRLVREHRRSLADIVAPRAEGRYGNPVLFDRRAYPALMAVEGDQGGKAVFDQFEISAVPADRSALVDVDTEEDWEALDGTR